MKALWNGTVIADSQDTVVVEGNHYFPLESVNLSHLEPSQTHSVCPWKGTASYYDVVVDGQRNPDAAWYYPEPKPAAAEISGRVAFWHGVKVVSASEVADGEGGSRRHPRSGPSRPASQPLTIWFPGLRQGPPCGEVQPDGESST